MSSFCQVHNFTNVIRNTQSPLLRNSGGSHKRQAGQVYNTCNFRFAKMLVGVPPNPRRRKVRSTPFPPCGENCARSLAPPLPTRPAPLGSRGGPFASGHRVQRLPCLRPRRYRSWALCAYSATTSESFSSSSESGPHKSV